MSRDKVNESDLETFNKSWSDFLGNLQITTKRRISSSTFLKQFIMMKYGKNLSKNDLFNFFRHETMAKSSGKNEGYALDGTSIVQFSRDLKACSAIYHDIELHPKENRFSTSNQMYVLFKILGVKQFHPLLMLFYFEQSSLKEAILAACNRMALSTLYSFTQANKIESSLPKLISTYYEQLSSHPEDRTTATKELIAGMDQYSASQATAVRSALTSRTLQRNKALDLLKTIELLVNQNNSIKGPNRGSKKIELEHILPVHHDVVNGTLDQLEFTDDKDYQGHLNLIGNLTLLYHPDNVKASDQMFDQKKAIYLNSDIKVTKAIVGAVKSNTDAGQNAEQIESMLQYEKSYDKETRWRKTCIAERSANLADLVVAFVTNHLALAE